MFRTNIQLIKIDAEGYEYPVLKGLSRYFEACGDRPPILCEITPRAYVMLGVTLADLAAEMRSRGYEARRIADYAPIDLTRLRFRCGNVIFLSRQSPGGFAS